MQNVPLIGAREALGALREMQRVASIAPSLEELHVFIGKFENHPVIGPRFRKLQLGEYFNDLGELKREIRDQLAIIKTEIAKRALEQVKAQRGASVQ